MMAEHQCDAESGRCTQAHPWHDLFTAIVKAREVFVPHSHDRLCSEA
jgi:hypothetical protein